MNKILSQTITMRSSGTLYRCDNPRMATDQAILRIAGCLWQFSF